VCQCVGGWRCCDDRELGVEDRGRHAELLDGECEQLYRVVGFGHVHIHRSTGSAAAFQASIPPRRL
jgi:hypothetical protein